MNPSSEIELLPRSAAELGQPLPPSIHAVSVALPRWEHVVGYEEKKPEVIHRLASGYPRFVVHPLVEKLAHQLSDGDACLPFPSVRAARLAAAFVRRTTGQPAAILNEDQEPGSSSSPARLPCVIASGPGYTALRLFWQHVGLIVSSRQAEAILAGRKPDPDSEAARKSLRQQLAAFYDCAEGDVFLAPTGMAALFAALQACCRRSPGRPTAQLGFPYVDTLKLQQKFGPGVVLLHDLDHLPARLKTLLGRERLAACFCEIPGNPLLGSADLRQVTPLLRQHRVPLIVDDVVATSVNIDVGGHADLIATSLTKFIAGSGDVMGGALICNPRSPLYAELLPLVRADHEELLWGEDALVLERQARTFPERMRRHNANGLVIAERLRGHPAVERVWYPKWEFSEAYEALRRPDGGWGALLTFLPRNGERNSPAFYDRLALCKGPSLGTVFTLACPFTLLAHYTELEWAEACGVSRHLLRLSIGLEDPEWLWKQIEAALNGGPLG